MQPAIGGPQNPSLQARHASTLPLRLHLQRGNVEARRQQVTSLAGWVRQCFPTCLQGAIDSTNQEHFK